MRHHALRIGQRVVVHGEALHDDVGTIGNAHEPDAWIGDEDFAAVAVDHHVRRVTQDQRDVGYQRIVRDDVCRARGEAHFRRSGRVADQIERILDERHIVSAGGPTKFVC